MANDVMKKIFLSVANNYIQHIVVLCHVTPKCVAKDEGSNEQVGSNRMHSIATNR